LPTAGAVLISQQLQQDDAFHALIASAAIVQLPADF
jgi:hypothetical protein